MAITRKRPVNHAAMRLECLQIAAAFGPCDSIISLAKVMHDFVATGAVPASIVPIRTTKRIPAKPAERG